MAPAWRMRLPTRRALIGVAFVLALVATSCGDDDNGAAASTTESATTTEDVTTTNATTTTAAVPTTTEPDGSIVEVYFSSGDGSDCSLVEVFTRSISEDADPVRAAFEELVAGPTTDEVEAGAGSFFSADTADVVSAVSLSGGLLIVDFADLRSLMPNASTSCGSEALLAQLNSTAFQFAAVDRVRYRMAGSCDEFGNWLQRDCFDADRGGQQRGVPTNERASGSGCTPAAGDSLSDGRWFGFVDDAQADRVSFDLACWFTGTAAAAAASEDGEESPPPNDFHIRNESDRLRTLTVDPAAEVAWLPNPGDPASLEVIAYDAWLAEQAGRPVRPGVWLNVDDGRVVSIDEQYVP